MDNKEEIYHVLEEFERQKPKDIPKELEEYLSFVAKTGDPVFLWSKVKFLFQQKLQHVLCDYYESCPNNDIAQLPNVDQFNFDLMKNKILEKFESFSSAPFTIQRLCELLTSPRKEYNRTDKFMRAVEKNILVVTTREPLAGCRDITPSPVVNGVDASSSTEQADDRSEAMEVESAGKAGASRFSDSRDDESAATTAQFAGESSRSPAGCPEQQQAKSPDDLNGLDEEESEEEEEASEEEDASEEDDEVNSNPGGTGAASAGKASPSLASHGSSNSNSSSSSSSSTGSPLASPALTDTAATNAGEARGSEVSCVQEDTSESTSSLLEEDSKTAVEASENTSSGATSPVECDSEEATTSPQPQIGSTSADALDPGSSTKLAAEEGEKPLVQKREHPAAENDSNCLVASPPSKRVCIEGMESVTSGKQPPAPEEDKSPVPVAPTSPDNSACVSEDTATSSSSKSETTNLSNGTANQEQ